MVVWNSSFVSRFSDSTSGGPMAPSWAAPWQRSQASARHVFHRDGLEAALPEETLGSVEQQLASLLARQPPAPCRGLRHAGNLPPFRDATRADPPLDVTIDGDKIGCVLTSKK